MPGWRPGSPAARRKLFAAGVVVLLAVITFLAFNDWMTYRRLGRENGDLRQRVREAIRRKQADLPRARDRLIELEDEQSQFQYLQRLPDEDQLEDLFDRLSEFEEVSRVDWEESKSVDRLPMQQRGPRAPYERLKYTLEMTGDFFGVCKFVNLLENMVRFATIDEFTIKRSRKQSDDASKPMCDIKLTFSVYRLIPSSPTAPAPGGPGGGGVRTARS